MSTITLPRNAQLWLPGYLRNRLAAKSVPSGGRVWVAIADHWEPYWLKPSDEIAASLPKHGEDGEEGGSGMGGFYSNN